MKAERVRCERCTEDRIVVTMSPDEAQMLRGDLPSDPSSVMGDIPTPMLELFAKRLDEVLESVSEPATTG